MTQITQDSQRHRRTGPIRPVQCLLGREGLNWRAACPELDIVCAAESEEAARTELHQAAERLWQQDEEEFRRRLDIRYKAIDEIVLRFTRPDPPDRFCLQCGYALQGLSENRCPECGRVFDPDKRETYGLAEDRARRAADLAGRSVAWAGVCQFVLPLALAWFTDALSLDAMGLVLWLLGQSVREGSRRAARWALALAGLYAIVGTIAVIVAVSKGQAGSLAAWFVPSRGQFPLILPLLLALWHGLNGALLIRLLRQLPRK